MKALSPLIGQDAAMEEVREYLRGWILSVDPASNTCGVSLWRDGLFIAGEDLKSGSPKDPLSRRLRDVRDGLERFLDKHAPGVIIDNVVCEGVRSRIVELCIGGLITARNVEARLHPKNSFVESPSWKRWAQLRGAKGPLKDIKGLKALVEIQWPFEKYPIHSDDVADSVMIFLAWRDRQK